MSVFSRHNLLIAVMALLGITMVSCNNDNCSGNSNAIPLAAFYEGQSNVSVPNLTVYGIGAPNDSCIISETSATLRSPHASMFSTTMWKALKMTPSA